MEVQDWLIQPIAARTVAEALVEVNVVLALRFHRQGRVFSIDTVELRGGLIVGYRRVMNPDKLTRI